MVLFHILGSSDSHPSHGFTSFTSLLSFPPPFTPLLPPLLPPLLLPLPPLLPSLLAADMNHRPSESLRSSKAYTLHLERTLKRAADMQREYKGYLDFTAEEETVKARLLAIEIQPPIVI